LTYRDERKLFAVIAVIIVAAVIALVQIAAARSGTPSPISAVGTSVLALVEEATSATGNAARNGATAVLSLPHLAHDNQTLLARNVALAQQNAQLHERVAADTQTLSLQPVIAANRVVAQARVIGFPPENESRSLTIDAGTRAGVQKDDGVMVGGGIVGIVQEADPLSSTVLLITDYASRIPAVVQRGRWWGIARGNLSSVRVEYVSQDAPLHLGDVVVTGEGRSFHSGGVIGTVTAIERSDTGLYQTAVVKPAVDLNALDRVVVVAQ
jgi:rod shape-determining protein MreC